MKVAVSELRKVANLLFDHLEASGNTEIDLDKDFYWSIPDEKLHSMYEQPSGFTAGQLTDDWRELQRLASGQRPPIAYALVWLSAILRRIGSKVVS